MASSEGQAVLAEEVGQTAEEAQPVQTVAGRPEPEEEATSKASLF